MIPLPTGRAPASIADWIEAELLFGETSRLSTTEMLDVLLEDLSGHEGWRDAYIDLSSVDDGELIDDDVERLVDFDENIDDSEELELAVDEAWQLLADRAAVVGLTYPLDVSDDLISRSLTSWQDNVVYPFLALLNVRRLLRLGSVITHHEPAKLFERLTVQSLADYLGGQSIRFGWPHDTSDFSGSFEERARQLASMLGETACPTMPTISGKENDYGLDVAAWIAIDGRPNKLMVFCQCGIGDDFGGKAVSIRGWSKVIAFATPPVPALAFPFIIEHVDTDWAALAADAGLLLDRVRIARLTSSMDPDLEAEITAWITQTLELVGW